MALQPPSIWDKGDEEEDQTSPHQHHALDRIGPHHGLEPTLGRVEGHQGDDDPEHDGKTEAGQLGQDQASPVQNRDQEDEDVRHQRRPTVDVSAEGTVSSRQQLRHRRDPILEIQRDEEEHEERVLREDEPLPIGDAHAGLVGDPHGPHDLLAGDAGGDEGGADDPPGQLPRGEKVVPRAPALPS